MIGRPGRATCHRGSGSPLSGLWPKRMHRPAGDSRKPRINASWRRDLKTAQMSESRNQAQLSLVDEERR